MGEVVEAETLGVLVGQFEVDAHHHGGGLLSTLNRVHSVRVLLLLLSLKRLLLVLGWEVDSGLCVEDRLEALSVTQRRCWRPGSR